MAFSAVVSYRNSTSNHNSGTTTPNSALLYLIEILHQTTTTMANNALGFSCILSKFYIKPQLFIVLFVLRFCCILSKFYIKPQLSYCKCLFQLCCILSKFYIKPQQPGGDQHRTQVVSYRNSTSNHNSSRRIDNPAKLYLIEILHQTTTVRFDGSTKNGCILSKFYIKPQPLLSTSKRSLSCILSKFYIKPQQLTPYRQPGEVVSYRNSTSNHNLHVLRGVGTLLYLIEILHQTTTFDYRPRFSPSCILSKFYIKPQRGLRLTAILPRCILSKFYIKPQPYKNYYANKQGCILSKFYIKPQR